MDAADVVRVIRADPGAYTEAHLLCTGTLWHQGAVTGLLKVPDMLIVNRGAPEVAPAVLAGADREAAARACGQAIRGLAVSRAAREHGIGQHPPATLTGALLAAALESVDWDAVGSKMLAATLAQLDYQARRTRPADGGLESRAAA